ncbi:hypothetical protein MOQ_004010, partial [Trypanosoma cruzi marinkellei]
MKGDVFLFNKSRMNCQCSGCSAVMSLSVLLLVVVSAMLLCCTFFVRLSTYSVPFFYFFALCFCRHTQ